MRTAVSAPLRARAETPDYPDLETRIAGGRPAGAPPPGTIRHSGGTAPCRPNPRLAVRSVADSAALAVTVAYRHPNRAPSAGQNDSHLESAEPT